jgi:hypothetical protein
MSAISSLPRIKTDVQRMKSYLKNILSEFSPISLEEMDKVSFFHRIDTKFVLNADKLKLLLSEIKDDYSVLEIDGKRCFSYSTIYYDTPDLRMYIDHIRGKLNRFKVRHREYVDTGMAYLEIKFKKNSGRTFKWREPEKSKNSHSGFTDNLLLKKHLPPHFKNLNPIIKNDFHRITLVDNKHTQRVTIDFDILYYTLEEKNKNKSKLSDLIIIEIKSDKTKEKNGIQKALNKLRIKKSGFSKYCMGVALTDLNKQKTGALKPRFIKINKLTNKPV